MRKHDLHSMFAIMVLALAAAPDASGQTADRAAEVLAESRKVIGGQKLEALKTLSVEAAMQRNVDTMQLSSDVELLIELPDKYVRNEQPNTPGVFVTGLTSGFNGERAIQPARGTPPGGGMMIRIGPGGPPPGGLPPGEAVKLSPEEEARLRQGAVRAAKHELSRLMLGWFAAAHPSVDARYVYAGEAESPDGRAHVVDVSGADGFAARLFIDQQTNLPLMVTYRAPQPRRMMMGRPGGRGSGARPEGNVTIGGGSRPAGDPAPTGEERAGEHGAEVKRPAPVLVDYTLYFEDWQSTDGVQFPQKIRRASAGETTEEWTIGKVRFNPAIDAKKFAVKD